MYLATDAIGTSRSLGIGIGFRQSLTDVDMKTMFVAVVILGILAALFYAYRVSFFNRQTQQKQPDPPPKVIPHAPKPPKDPALKPIQQTYKKRIEAEINGAEAYYLLANTLDVGEETELLNKEKKSREDLLLQSIAIDSNFAMSYYTLGTDLPDEIDLPDDKKRKVTVKDNKGTETPMNKMALLCKSLELGAKQAYAHYYLAVHYPGISINGKQMSKIELLIECIACDPKLAEASKLTGAYYEEVYYQLGMALKTGETVTLSGEKVTQEDLFLKSVHLKPKFGPAYCALGTLLIEKGKANIKLKGREVTQSQLFQKCIELAPDFGDAYKILGDILPNGAMITLEAEIKFKNGTELKKGTKLTKKQILLQSTELNPYDARSYCNLGNTLSAKEAVTLPDGVKYKREDLLYRSIELDAEFVPAYVSLAAFLTPGKTAEVPGVAPRTKRELCLQIIAFLDQPNYDITKFKKAFADTYYHLGTTLTAGGSVSLWNGKPMMQEELYKKCIELDAKHAEAYRKLSDILPVGGETTLNDGTVMTKEKLKEKHDELSKN